MVKQVSLARALVHSFEKEEGGLDNNPLLKEALIALWETDPLLKIQKREAVLEKGFPVHEWLVLSFKANDLEAMEDWTHPIDWQTKLTTNPRETETILKNIIQKDKADWLAFAFEQGATPQTSISLLDDDGFLRTFDNKDNKTKTVSLLEFLMSSIVCCEKCWPLIFSHSECFKDKYAIGVALLLNSQISNDLLVEKRRKYQQLLIEHFDICAQRKDSPPWIDLFLRELGFSNVQADLNSPLIKHLLDLKSDKLVDVLGNDGVWSWLINHEFCHDILDLRAKNYEGLFHHWENTLASSGLLKTSSFFNIISIKIKNTVGLYSEEEVLKDLAKFKTLGGGEHLQQSLNWTAWHPTVLNAFNEIFTPNRREIPKSFLTLLNDEFHDFLDNDTLIHWTEIKKDIRKEWDIIVEPNQNKKITLERFKLFLATLPSPKNNLSKKYQLRL